ncbi:conserved Plasmodium protein, unknown function [Plasmodium sp. gorilla clade G2]|uniref:conserved Plasmodium protein, unknown function n=1 Tax=Plasmodium sp. gorilla clade G2 TaxID=880535 RepID=UPI000D200A26|nr:conserved Plasmodium protein, unknown function [Plasmodium sp. gorilla clade G2]SOV15126.1 conserved Plasmodium protein, unknown function [Plasmodium sp. gorilla clade G2]
MNEKKNTILKGKGYILKGANKEFIEDKKKRDSFIDKKKKNIFSRFNPLALPLLGKNKLYEEDDKCDMKKRRSNEKSKEGNININVLNENEFNSYLLRNKAFRLTWTSIIEKIKHEIDIEIYKNLNNVFEEIYLYSISNNEYLPLILITAGTNVADHEIIIDALSYELKIWNNHNNNNNNKKKEEKYYMNKSGNLFDYVHGEGKDYIYEKIKRDMNKKDNMNDKININQSDHLYDKIYKNKGNFIFTSNQECVDNFMNPTHDDNKIKEKDKKKKKKRRKKQRTFNGNIYTNDGSTFNSNDNNDIKNENNYDYNDKYNDKYNDEYNDDNDDVYVCSLNSNTSNNINSAVYNIYTQLYRDYKMRYFLKKYKKKSVHNNNMNNPYVSSDRRKRTRNYSNSSNSNNLNMDEQDDDYNISNNNSFVRLKFLNKEFKEDNKLIHNKNMVNIDRLIDLYKKMSELNKKNISEEEVEGYVNKYNTDNIIYNMEQMNNNIMDSKGVMFASSEGIYKKNKGSDINIKDIKNVNNMNGVNNMNDCNNSFIKHYGRLELYNKQNNYFYDGRKKVRIIILIHDCEYFNINILNGILNILINLRIDNKICLSVILGVSTPSFFFNRITTPDTQSKLRIKTVDILNNKLMCDRICNILLFENLLPFILNFKTVHAIKLLLHKNNQSISHLIHILYILTKEFYDNNILSFLCIPMNYYLNIYTDDEEKEKMDSNDYSPYTYIRSYQANLSNFFKYDIRKVHQKIISLCYSSNLYYRHLSYIKKKYSTILIKNYFQLHGQDSVIQTPRNSDDEPEFFNLKTKKLDHKKEKKHIQRVDIESESINNDIINDNEKKNHFDRARYAWEFKTKTINWWYDHPFKDLIYLYENETIKNNKKEEIIDKLLNEDDYNNKKEVINNIDNNINGNNNLYDIENVKEINKTLCSFSLPLNVLQLLERKYAYNIAINLINIIIKTKSEYTTSIKRSEYFRNLFENYEKIKWNENKNILYIEQLYNIVEYDIKKCINFLIDMMTPYYFKNHQVLLNVFKEFKEYYTNIYPIVYNLEDYIYLLKEKEYKKNQELYINDDFSKTYTYSFSYSIYFSLLSRLDDMLEMLRNVIQMEEQKKNQANKCPPFDGNKFNMKENISFNNSIRKREEYVDDSYCVSSMGEYKEENEMNKNNHNNNHNSNNHNSNNNNHNSNNHNNCNDVEINGHHNPPVNYNNLDNDSDDIFNSNATKYYPSNNINIEDIDNKKKRFKRYLTIDNKSLKKKKNYEHNNINAEDISNCINLFIHDYIYLLLLPPISYHPLAYELILYKPDKDFTNIMTRDIKKELLTTLCYTNPYKTGNLMCSSCCLFKDNPYNNNPENNIINNNKIYLNPTYDNISTLEDMVNLYRLYEKCNKTIDLYNLFILYLNLKVNKYSSICINDKNKNTTIKNNNNNNINRQCKDEQDVKSSHSNRMKYKQTDNLATDILQEYYLKFIITINTFCSFLKILKPPNVSALLNYNEKNGNNDDYYEDDEYYNNDNNTNHTRKGNKNKNKNNDNYNTSQDSIIQFLKEIKKSLQGCTSKKLLFGKLYYNHIIASREYYLQNFIENNNEELKNK